MTEEQFLKKVLEISQNLEQLCMDKAHSLIASGAVDLESYDDNYVLPKIFMCAMGSEIEWQYKPHTKSALSEVSNMKKMI